MKYQKNIITYIRVCLVASIILYSRTVKSQDFKQKYDSILLSNNVSSLKKIYGFAKSSNPNDFVKLSYYIDANNMMYQSTGEKKYLDYNYTIVEYLISSGKKDTKNSNLSRRWTARIGQHQSNAHMNGKEFILYEGYLFRHLANFAYLVKKSQLYPNEKKLMIKEFVEDNFLKIYNQSIGLYGDLSELYSIRTHMGSHWAMTALYLYPITNNKVNKNIYKQVISEYNKGLKQNFKLKNLDKDYYYQWNSTWDIPFTRLQKSKKRTGKEQDEIQDVAHGNQVVEYIIAAHEMGYPDWSYLDLQYLANTLKNKIGFSKNAFAATIDGKRGKNTVDTGAGYKQSTGWMKLAKYDQSKKLKALYKDYYISNRVFIDKMYLNLQYYANFLQFDKN